MMNARGLLQFLLALLFLAAMFLVVYAGWVEPSTLRVSAYSISQPSPLLKGMRIAVISDLHGGAPHIDTAKIDRVVAMTNAAKPDLVLLAGDYVIGHVLGGEHMPIETIAAHLKGLHAPLGVYAVLGNHDRWEDPDHIANALRQAGIPVMANSHVILPAPRNAVTLVGIGDRASGGARPGKALDGVTGPALCFTHSPDIFPRLAPICALTIAGHTHGGQIFLPMLGRPAVAEIASRYGQRYAIGIIRERGMILFVSPGIGTSGLPLRFGVPPEISLLTLQ
jgi:predicted MPP superfamily phosphohydrolase